MRHSIGVANPEASPTTTPPKRQVGRADARLGETVRHGRPSLLTHTERPEGHRMSSAVELKTRTCHVHALLTTKTDNPDFAHCDRETIRSIVDGGNSRFCRNRSAGKLSCR